MKQETLKKISKCKALQGMTVEGVIKSDRFRENLAAYLTAQREDRKAIRSSYAAMRKAGGAKGYYAAIRKAGGAKGYKLRAHVIDKFMDCSVEEFAKEYLKVLSKMSPRPMRERQYIGQLGQQAYNLTIAQIVIDEFPETAEELIPKSKSN